MLIHIDPEYSNISNNHVIQTPINNNNIKLNNYLTDSDVKLYFQTFGSSFSTKAIPISKNECILIPANNFIRNKINKSNYFYGLSCKFTQNGKLSIISSYDNKNFIVTCKENIFDYQFSNIASSDSNLDELYIDIEIMNHSFEKQGNLLCLLGTDYTTITCGMIVENYTQRWKSAIRYVGENFVLLEDSSFDYGNDDRYIVYNKKKDYFLSIEMTSSNIMDDETNFWGVSVQKNIHYAKKDHFIMLINKDNQEDVRYFKIKEIKDDSIYFLDENTINISDFLLLIIPYSHIISVLDINKEVLRQRLYLQLKSVIFPKKLTEEKMNQKEPDYYPFIYINVNSIKNSFYSSLDKDYTFVGFLSVDNNICYQYKSDQIICIDQNLKDSLSISFFNPNHEPFSTMSSNQILTFNSDNNNTIKVVCPNRISIIFHLYI
jgi:hypothetical protein